MPYMKNGKRDYKTEYSKYHSRTTQKKNRAQRNSARRTLSNEGLVSKGDGKDVAHKRAISKGGTNQRGNLSVSSKKSNRSFSRTKTGKMK